MQGGQVVSIITIIIFCQSWVPIHYLLSHQKPSKTMVQDGIFQRVSRISTEFPENLARCNPINSVPCLDYLEYPLTI